MLSHLGCGLKRAPKAPSDTSLPSITERYKYKFDPDKAEEEAQGAEDGEEDKEEESARKADLEQIDN